MDNRLLAAYYFHFGAHRQVNVFGCWDKDTDKDIDSGEFDFYDLQDAHTDECLNLGDPLDEFPTWLEVMELLESKEVG